ncbi:MAG: HD domain-containing protein [Eubacterium sp.]|nr:HD domain-containing protein [Eubacterium sp.]
MKRFQSFCRRIRTGLFTACFGAALLYGYAGTVYAEGISGGDHEEINVDPTGQGEGFSAVLYDNTKGLPTSEANAIAETKEGFLWIGSYSGMVRYDGNTFERVDSTTGVTSVVSLYVDSKDRLWIGTNDNGVAMMEKGVITSFKGAEGIKSDSVKSIVEDDQGNIYIATTLGIGVIDQDLTLHPVDEPQINSEYVCEFRKGEDGVIYGETMKGAVFTIENGKLSGFYDGKKMGIEGVYTVLPDPDNNDYVYIGTDHSEIYYGKLGDGMKNAKVINVSPLGCVNSMEKIQGQLWICADNGIGMIDKNGKFTRLGNIPMNNSITHILTDYQGNLWFTSSRQGVMKIVPNRFSDIYELYGLEPAVVNATCRLDDKLYVGTDTGATIIQSNMGSVEVPIEELTLDGEKYTTLNSLLSGCRIRAILRDSKDRLWFSTFSDHGLIMFDHGKAIVYRTENGLASNRVRSVYELSDGQMMISCSGGVAIMKDGVVVDMYDNGAGLSNLEILTMAEADNGDLIFGSDGDGIYVAKGHKVTNIGKESGLGSEVILRIRKDTERNIFWIITSNSISYMTADYKVTTIDKFPYSNNFDIYWNKAGEMWILSSNGIYVLKAEELMANGELSPVFYNRDNGLPYVSTANSYSDLGADGELYISGTAGVSKVNIEKNFDDVSEIRMAVPFVEIDGELKYAADDGSFTIPADTKRLTIYSFVYSYSLLNPQVTYHLEGFDQSSITVSRDKLEPIDYTNLDGGEYTFVMELTDSMGKGNEKMTVRIVKTKSVYEETWFMVTMAVLGVLLIIGLVFFIVRRKTKALLAKQEENRTLIREISEAFAKTIDLKDKYTNGHSTRVAEYTTMLAKELGYDDETVEKYRNIALLHDIGKIGVPPEVLNKPGKLTDEEFKIIKSHSSLGYRVLKDISIMPELAIGAGSHHERPDGKGYPKGLKGDEIPRVAQIIAVADTFDAMYSDRPYRKRMNFEKAVSIIKEVSGTQLEADVVDAFLRLVDKGEFRAEDDNGGGTFEDINNIHKKQEAAEDGKKEASS